MLDHAGPTRFEPSLKPRGVDAHPHRGFETVTILFQGEVEHRDSKGNHGLLRAGDVQWMTAASGIVHEEKHSETFTRQGGTLELIQLWVNLPGAHKMEAPGYQDIASSFIPHIPLKGGQARVIAGEFLGQKGPARTFTPITLADIQLQAGTDLEWTATPGQTAILYVSSGAIRYADGQTAPEAHTAFLDAAGETIRITADTDARVVFLAGEPIDEPVVSYGPFVMNTVEEISQAVDDFNSGKMGWLN